MHVSESSNFKISKSIPLISLLLVNEFLNPLVELFRRPVCIKHINLISFCSESAEIEWFEVDSKFINFSKCHATSILTSNFSRILAPKLLDRFSSKFYTKFLLYVSLC